MNIKYPVYKPDIRQKEKEYVNECLNSTWISSKGKFVDQFEGKFADFHNAGYAIAVSNGTVALHVAILALGLGPGDEILVPSFTYIASVNAIIYAGATPVFVDSDPASLQMDPDDLQNRITPRSKAILAVHLYGDACDIIRLKEIAKKHRLFLIEDCAESFGTRVNDQLTGTFGDISTFSFFGNKTITTGEGGMILTNDQTLDNLSRRIKGQGLAEGREYWHDIIGYNYRMTNICAAIGLAQLERANEIIEKKRIIASWYDKYLTDIPVELPRKTETIYHTYWMYNIMVRSVDSREKLRNHLRSCGIETRPSFYPVHQMPMYNTGMKLPVAEDISLRGINLPSYPELKETEVAEICHCVETFFT